MLKGDFEDLIKVVQVLSHADTQRSIQSAKTMLQR